MSIASASLAGAAISAQPQLQSQSSSTPLKRKITAKADPVKLPEPR